MAYGKFLKDQRKCPHGRCTPALQKGITDQRLRERHRLYRSLSGHAIDWLRSKSERVGTVMNSVADHGESLGEKYSARNLQRENGRASRLAATKSCPRLCRRRGEWPAPSARRGTSEVRIQPGVSLLCSPSVNSKRAPCPGRASARIQPPWRRMILAATASPTPFPLNSPCACSRFRG